MSKSDQLHTPVSQPHTHTLADGTVYTHTHTPAQSTPHASGSDVLPDIGSDAVSDVGSDVLSDVGSADGSYASHGHSPVHAHVHDPADKKRQLNRLSRIVGHLQHVRLMIEDDADCAEVLVQIAAVRSALNGLGKQIINEHISHCIAHAVEEGDTTAIEEFQKAIEKYL